MATAEKKLTTTALTDSMFLDVGGEMIEMAHAQATHTYLETKSLGDLSKTATGDVKHRIHIAWIKIWSTLGNTPPPCVLEIATKVF